MVRGMGTKDSPFVLTLGLAKFLLKPLGVLTPRLHRNDGVTRPPLTQVEFCWPFCLQQSGNYYISLALRGQIGGWQFLVQPIRIEKSRDPREKIET